MHDLCEAMNFLFIYFVLLEISEICQACHEYRCVYYAYTLAQILMFWWNMSLSVQLSGFNRYGEKKNNVKSVTHRLTDSCILKVTGDNYQIKQSNIHLHTDLYQNSLS